MSRKVLRFSSAGMEVGDVQKHGEILGVHMIGPHVTAMIAEAVVAMVSEATVEELAHSIHPHPSLSEVTTEAALDVLGESLHKG